jgi:hypothetical protein
MSFLNVIPAKAGIQSFHLFRIRWIPVFTGMTTLYEFTSFGYWDINYDVEFEIWLLEFIEQEN